MNVVLDPSQQRAETGWIADEMGETDEMVH